MSERLMYYTTGKKDETVSAKSYSDITRKIKKFYNEKVFVEEANKTDIEFYVFNSNNRIKPRDIWYREEKKIK